MAQVKIKARVESQVQLADGVYSMELLAPEIASAARA